MKKLIFYTIPVLAVVPLTLVLSATYPLLHSFSKSATRSFEQDTVKIILEETRFKDIPILYITDTALTTANISEVLGKGYGELMQYINGNKLRPGKFMAWYNTTQPPWQIDIAVETDKIPKLLNGGRIKSRIQEGGAVLIAHVWGPYDQVSKAYEQIGDWMKKNNRKAKGNSFEVYINDPGAVKSSAEIQTDVYQPLR